MWDLWGQVGWNRQWRIRGGTIYDICPYMYMYEFNSISVVVLSRHCWRLSGPLLWCCRTRSQFWWDAKGRLHRGTAARATEQMALWRGRNHRLAYTYAYSYMPVHTYSCILIHTYSYIPIVLVHAYAIYAYILIHTYSCIHIHTYLCILIQTRTYLIM